LCWTRLLACWSSTSREGPTMRLDVVTIFPEYLSPLDLSLIGKAREQGVIQLRVHDLRDFTHDRHRSVDDTPYGGGAGMVMRAEPWAEALEHVMAAGAHGDVPHLLVLGPGGVRFTQAMARELAAEPWLAFACGRYEGIDQRVIAHTEGLMPVTVVSLGDYVLGGGEVAALVMIEAIARLVPGVIGNADSLVEESHEDGLLEYPMFTKPPQWRGHGVPEVLLSGHHEQIARWRRDERLRRTALRRPDMIARLDPADLDARDREVLAEALSSEGGPTQGAQFQADPPAVAD
jgi:tRNA (guanine37-N1)-methyltransferase